MALQNYSTWGVIDGQREIACFANEVEARRFADMYRQSLGVMQRVYVRPQTERFTAEHVEEIRVRTGVSIERAE